jgi:hypothetical protein
MFFILHNIRRVIFLHIAYYIFRFWVVCLFSPGACWALLPFISDFFPSLIYRLWNNERHTVAGGLINGAEYIHIVSHIQRSYTFLFFFFIWFSSSFVLPPPQSKSSLSPRSSLLLPTRILLGAAYIYSLLNWTPPAFVTDWARVIGFSFSNQKASR